MKPIIICIVGASGTGKTTLTLGLKQKYNIHTLISYTTRPMRPKETQGVEHKFVTEFSKSDTDEVLAYAVYGGYQYWTLASQVTGNLTTYIIDKGAMDHMIHRFSDKFDFIKVLIERDNITGLDMQRIERDKEHPVGFHDEYDIVVKNTGSIDEFVDNVAAHLETKVKDIRKDSLTD